LVLDHSHATGKVRRFLCRPCNTGLGCYKDDPNLTDAASAYLRLFEEPEGRGIDAETGAVALSK
jgi:Recombination endonuclease VII